MGRPSVLLERTVTQVAQAVGSGGTPVATVDAVTTSSDAPGSPSRSVTLLVVGDLDAYSAPDLYQPLVEALKWQPNVCVDLSGVTFIDGAGLTLLVALR